MMMAIGQMAGSECAGWTVTMATIGHYGNRVGGLHVKPVTVIIKVLVLIKTKRLNTNGFAVVFVLNKYAEAFKVTL